MRVILTAKGDEILVDDEDFERLNAVKWNLAGAGYPSRRIRIPNTPPGTYRSEYMHRVLMGLPFGDKRMVDHINGVRTDNRRENLRVCVKDENMFNRGHTVRNKSGLKGVSWSERDQVWRAQIHAYGKQKNLGSFQTKEAAYEAYCAASIDLHGEFSRLS